MSLLYPGQNLLRMVNVPLCLGTSRRSSCSISRQEPCNSTDLTEAWPISPEDVNSGGGSHRELSFAAFEFNRTQLRTKTGAPKPAICLRPCTIGSVKGLTRRSSGRPTH